MKNEHATFDFKDKVGQTYLEMSGIHKHFHGVHALKGVNFDLRHGEVHALMGENGAGKSTLVKILTGVHKYDEGNITFMGTPYKPDCINDSQAVGIGIVHQELNMLKDLTIAQNVFVGREFMDGRFWISDKRMVEESAKLFEMLSIDIDPREKLDKLTVGKQQMVEIAKAISYDSKLIVFDEPTAALTQNEIVELFKIINQLKAAGIGIIYISHRMDEVMELSDRITVMRDGEYVGTVDTPQTSKDEIIKMMIGRVVYENPKTHSMVHSDAPVLLEARNICVGKTVQDVSFTLRKGEILGVSGLMGAGRTELARAIFGADKMDSGQLYVNGKLINVKNPQDAIEHGICYLSEDRKRYGVLLNKSIADNSALPSLDNYIKFGFINDKKIKSDAIEYNAKLSTKTSSITNKVGNLSGGNQQKVIIAKWLLKNTDIIIFDEPTRGIDVGAKSEIYQLMNELSKAGKSIIMISSELVEIQRMSDRVMVMCEGRKTGELDIKDATQEAIMTLATAQ